MENFDLAMGFSCSAGNLITMITIGLVNSLDDIYENYEPMDGIESRQKYFPLNSLQSVLSYIKFEVENDSPSLLLVSLVLGFFESSLTARKKQRDGSDNSSPSPSDGSLTESGGAHTTATDIYPVLDFDVAKQYYENVTQIFEDEESIAKLKSACSKRDAIKIVSQIVWNSLSQKYCRDKPHIQTLYSLSTSQQLDAFGVSIAVISACHHLGVGDVHLCVAEDHSWVAFGTENAEVTWHGKSGEEKQGLPLPSLDQKGAWLYLNGNAIACENQIMELVCVVNAMNPIVETGIDSFEVVTIQLELLKYLHSRGFLDQHPLALSNLGNLLELTADIDGSSKIYQVGISASIDHFKNSMVYPYTFYAGFLLRNSCIRGALWCWAESANVLASFSYSREDEEIYKEMYEIAVDVLPGLFKGNSIEISEVINDPLCFYLLLKFYDGLCLWEEGSQIPVLHINWSRAICSCLSKFPAKTRTAVNFESPRCDIPEKTNSVVSKYDHILSLEKCALEFLTKLSSFKMTHDEEIGISLKSTKMAGIKELLCDVRLRPTAIQLHLTAQTANNSSSQNSLSSRNSLPEEQNSAGDQQRMSKRRRFVTTKP